MKVRILAGILAAWPSIAFATTGLEWQLPEEGVRYLIGARVQLAAARTILGEQNLDARVSEIRQQVIATCKPASAAGKKGWNVVCTLDDVALQAAPPHPDEGRAAPIMEEWAAELTGTSVQFTLMRDGRMRTVDLQGVSRDNRRTNEIAEWLRRICARSFAAFDLELPKNGDDHGEPWRQRSPSQFGFLSGPTGPGSGDVLHRVSATGGSVVTLTTEGDGTFSGSDTVSTGGEPHAANTFEMRVTGSAQFDTERGLLLERTYRVDGDVTASSILAQTGSAYPYVQIVTLRMLGEETPQLPGTGEIARVEL